MLRAPDVAESLVGWALPTKNSNVTTNKGKGEYLMPVYRRAKTPGGTYFFTVVTYRRRPIFTKSQSREILRQVIHGVRQSHPFTIDAWVLLPDHFHCLWTLPEGDADYSKRWGLIKSGFSKKAKQLFHHEEWMNQSKQRHRESTIWQRRFWEHHVRDEQDYRNHVDYLHYNPVKHGLVEHVEAWPYSTFHRYVEKGVYPKDWGNNCNKLNGDYGE